MSNLPKFDTREIYDRITIQFKKGCDGDAVEVLR
jgi:hypothetical protein